MANSHFRKTRRKSEKADGTEEFLLFRQKDPIESRHEKTHLGIFLSRLGFVRPTTERHWHAGLGHRGCGKWNRIAGNEHWKSGKWNRWSWILIS